MNNVVSIPKDRGVLARQIRDAFERCEHGRQQWIEGTLQLAAFLKEARELFQADRDFAHWIVDVELEDINHQDRAALIGMADDLSTARTILTETKRSSWQLIWAEEKHRFTRASKPTASREGKKMKTATATVPRTAPSRPDTQIKMPQDKTPEEIAREGIRLEAEGNSAPTVAKMLGVYELNYRRMRDIVVLAEHTALLPRDRAIAQAALADMNATRQIARALPMVEPIMNRLWGDSNTRRAADRKAIERRRAEDFERAVGSIISAAKGSARVEIPYLSPSKIADLKSEISEAVGALQAFSLRIQETSK